MSCSNQSKLNRRGLDSLTPGWAQARLSLRSCCFSAPACVGGSHWVCSPNLLIRSFSWVFPSRGPPQISLSPQLWDSSPFNQGLPSPRGLTPWPPFCEASSLNRSSTGQGLCWFVLLAWSTLSLTSRHCLHYSASAQQPLVLKNEHYPDTLTDHI